VQEGDLAVVIFVILSWFQNRGILGRGQMGLAFGLGCEPKQKPHILSQFLWEQKSYGAIENQP